MRYKNRILTAGNILIVCFRGSSFTTLAAFFNWLTSMLLLSPNLLQFDQQGQQLFSI